MFDTDRAAMVEAGRRLADTGLVTGTSGNLSVRRGDRVLVTASGTTLGALSPELLTVVDLDGSIVAGELEPTSELPLHLLVYRATAATAIAHAHAMASIAVGCTHDVLPPVHYATVALGGVVRVAPYATFGSAELAEHVHAALVDRTAALMRNHGSVAIGDDLAQACERLELVEWLAETYRRAAALGRPRLLTEADLDEVRRELDRRDYGTPRRVAP